MILKNIMRKSVICAMSFLCGIAFFLIWAENKEMVGTQIDR